MATESRTTDPGHKTDFKKTLASYRAPKGRFEVLDVPPMQYLMIDGSGDPNISTMFTESIETLYPVAYALKFASKRNLGRDYVVPPLEGLWWSEDLAAFTRNRDKSQWQWTLMLMVPDWLDAAAVTAAIEQAASKSPPRLAEIRLQSLAEGRCVQTLHLGSFEDEGPVLSRMHDEFIPEQGLRLSGTHHEVYLSDFRKVEATRLRTILRQPVAPAG